MEDGYSTMRTMTEESLNSHRFCGVFDGHAQSQMVAELLGKLLPKRLGDLKPAEWMSREGLEKVCLSVDKDILRSKLNDAGSTAIFCIIENTKSRSNVTPNIPDSVSLTLASVGDSQAMIIHREFSKEPTIPLGTQVHRPNLMSSESDRVSKAGGFVKDGRVDGELAVSRAFGDSKFKKDISRKLTEQKVIAVPSVAEGISLRTGDILVLACDGLFDSMPATEVDKFVRSCLMSSLVKRKHSDSMNHVKEAKEVMVSEVLAEVAGKLADEALLRGSRDNISIMLIQMVEPTHPSEPRSWSDRRGKRYIPPVLFVDPSDSFISIVKDELKKFRLAEDEILPVCETLVDPRLIGSGFCSSFTRSQLTSILVPVLSRQWENRAAWVEIEDMEIPHKRKKRSSKRSNLLSGFFSKFKYLCASGVNEVPPQRKARHLSSSANASSLRVSSVMSISEIQSRQTSADELIVAISNSK
jgi:serine/threonine protein phosphatase PrpC